MLYVESDGTIKLTRGDSASLTINISNDITSEDYLINENDELTLTVKKNTKTYECVFKKTIKGTNIFNIEPSDTKYSAFGKYTYDVQLTTSTGEVYTVIPPKRFEILEEVTF